MTLSFHSILLAGLLITRALPAQEGQTLAADVNVLNNVSYYDGAGGDGEGFQTLDLFVPQGVKNFPTVIFVHGGGWTRKTGDAPTKGRGGPHNQGFARQGIAVASISYRLTPAVQHPEHIRDVARAVVWVKRNIASHGGRADAIFIAGHSAGGHLVALLATDERWLKAEGLSLRDIRGVIPISAAFNLLGEMAGKAGPVFGDDEAERRAASPLTHVRPGLPPFLILHGDSEINICGPQAAQFHQALHKAGDQSTLLAVPGRTHSTIITKFATTGDPAGEAVVKFIHMHAP